MDELATDMGTIVETLFGEAADRGRADSTSTQPAPSLSVPMDIDEGDDHYLVSLDVPGVPIESIELDMHEDTLTVRGERLNKASTAPPKVSGDAASEATSDAKEDSGEASAQTQSRRRERAFGRFQRVVRLPLPVENDAVTAEMSEGVLVVTLPKADPEKGKRRVPVSRR